VSDTDNFYSHFEEDSEGIFRLLADRKEAQNTFYDADVYKERR
jgi:hypothetical protein